MVQQCLQKKSKICITFEIGMPQHFESLYAEKRKVRELINNYKKFIRMYFCANFAKYETKQHLNQLTVHIRI